MTDEEAHMPDQHIHSVSVAGVVVDESGRVLVIQRSDNSRWEPPGGILERDETFEQGVAREIAEETGVIVEVERLTGVYKNMTRGIVALVYRCQPLAGTARPTSESVAVDWITPGDVHARMAPAYAVRVLDALATVPASRAHNGQDLLPSAAARQTKTHPPARPRSHDRATMEEIWDVTYVEPIRSSERDSRDDAVEELLRED